MLTARQFIEIDASAPVSEKSRLEWLHAQLEHQPFAEKQRIVEEFVAIIENRSEKIWARILACTILGGRKQELDISRSKVVTSRICEVLQAEFVGNNPSVSSSFKKKPSLQDREPFSVCFLEVILLTLLRIDLAEMHTIVDRALDVFEDSQQKTALAEVISLEIKKLS